MEEISPVGVFLSAAVVSALSGLAALLRSGERLSFLSILSSLLNSGMLGLGISLVWYTKFQSNVYFLIGVCLLAGLGGMTTVDFVLKAIRKGGLKIQFGDSVKMGEEEKK